MVQINWTSLRGSGRDSGVPPEQLRLCYLPPNSLNSTLTGGCGGM